MASDFIPHRQSPRRLAERDNCLLADENSEGRSIVVLAKEKFGLRGREVRRAARASLFRSRRRRAHEWRGFSSLTRSSASRSIRKGASESIRIHVDKLGGSFRRRRSRNQVENISRSGGTPLVVAENSASARLVQLKDVVKRHQGTLCAPSQNGNQDDHDHRRQSAHRRSHRG